MELKNVVMEQLSGLLDSLYEFVLDEEQEEINEVEDSLYNLLLKKEKYKVQVFGESKSCFEELYTEEEIKTIEKFMNDMEKHNVASYDYPAIEFTKMEEK